MSILLFGHSISLLNMSGSVLASFYLPRYTSCNIQALLLSCDILGCNDYIYILFVTFIKVPTVIISSLYIYLKDRNTSNQILFSPQILTILNSYWTYFQSDVIQYFCDSFHFILPLFSLSSLCAFPPTFSSIIVIQKWA